MKGKFSFHTRSNETAQIDTHNIHIADLEKLW